MDQLGYDGSVFLNHEPSVRVLEPERLFDHLPAEGIWSGAGIVRFISPDGELRGPTTIKLSADGEASIEMDVQDVDIPKDFGSLSGVSLMTFVEGRHSLRKGDKTIFQEPSREHEISKLEVEVQSGVFTATRGFVSSDEYGDRALLGFTANDLVFKPSVQGPPAYWLLPLLGDLKEYARGSFLIDHPMALQGGGIPFTVEGGRCCLQVITSPQPLDASSLTKYDATVFGDVLGPSNNIDELLQWFPSDLMNALRFATGSNIKAPWIETRTISGDLVCRIHSRFGRRGEGRGSPAFSWFDGARPGSGIGEFLRCFFALPQDHRNLLIAPMNLIQSGSPGNATIEETIGDLVQALDALCEVAGVARQNLLAKLSPKTANAVKGITKSANKQMKKLRSVNKGNVNELVVLNRIDGRLANVATDERDFGLAVTDLLGKYGLRDADVMNASYSTLPTLEVTWEGLLSAVRGAVLHSGGFRSLSRVELRKWFSFNCHLHDICKRVILSYVGYTGTYAASNARYTGTYEVNRVTSQTAVQQLGYSEPPTHI